MAKAQRASFVCQNCGAVSNRWAGKCAGCGEWNTIVEELDGPAPPGTGLSRASKGRAITLEALRGDTSEAPRMPTGLSELDRVTGGGIVPGSALLFGGEPGIGKSTLLLQLSAMIAKSGRSAVYFSGEEAAAQVRLRAERLGLADATVGFAAETNLANILATLTEGRRPDLVVIDSIQTLWADALESAPGTVSQVRGATQALIRFAKQSGSALVLVGHVTKDGQIAGPKVIEHMVDTVLYFEGDSGHPFRILRAVKNRFGATDEIGVFEMVQTGPRRGRQSVGAVPRRPRCQDAGRCGVRGDRGHAAFARRDSSTCGAIRARHAAPRGGRLGRQPAVDAAGRARCPLRRVVRPGRRLPQRRRRHADRRAGRRSGRRRRPAVVIFECCSAAGSDLLRGDQPVRGGATGGSHDDPAERGA